MKKFLKWIPAIIVTSISWYLSDQEHIEQMPEFWNADKLIHLICFGGLCFLVSFGCNISRIKMFWLPVLIVSVYGIIDEFHQSFTPGRFCSVLDWVADSAGAVLGVFAYLGMVRLVRKFIGVK